MARKSTRENKNIYQRTRESLDLTREEASDLLITMSPARSTERNTTHSRIDNFLLLEKNASLFCETDPLFHAPLPIQ